MLNTQVQYTVICSHQNEEIRDIEPLTKVTVIHVCEVKHPKSLTHCNLYEEMGQPYHMKTA